MAAFDFRLTAFSLMPLLNGPYDSGDAFVSVRARTAVGSPSWPRMLLRTYQRWAERMGFAVAWIDGEPETHPDDHGDGLLRITGPYACGLLRGEVGVHRLVRLVQEGRRQTFFADVDVLPDAELPLPPMNELRRDTFRAGGPGTQHS